MIERWVGITVSGKKVTLVDATVSSSGPITINADQSCNLQEGDRPDAYSIMHQHISDYLRENKIQRVVFKSSALTMGAMKKAHLEAAELRGVTMAAAASVARTQSLAKAHISRTFGNRKVDEYLKDDSFWSTELNGESVRIGSREAAMVLLAARELT